MNIANLTLLIPLLVPLAAFLLDVITGRGVGLVVLSVAALGFSAWMLWAIQEVEARAAQQGNSFRGGLSVGLSIGLTLILMDGAHLLVGLCALVLPTVTGQWRWFAAIMAGLLSLAMID